MDDSSLVGCAKTVRDLDRALNGRTERERAVIQFFA